MSAFQDLRRLLANGQVAPEEVFWMSDSVGITDRLQCMGLPTRNLLLTLTHLSREFESRGMYCFPEILGEISTIKRCNRPPGTYPGMLLGDVAALVLAPSREIHRPIAIPADANDAPPKFAEFVLHLVIPRKHRMTLLGDIYEIYRRLSQPEKLGKTGADWWFRFEVLKSIPGAFWLRLVLAWLFIRHLFL
jgi:hypothetical protein